MKTTCTKDENNTQKINIELDENKFLIIKIAVASLIEKYQEVGLDQSMPENFAEMKDIEMALHDIQS